MTILYLVICFRNIMYLDHDNVSLILYNIISYFLITSLYCVLFFLFSISKVELVKDTLHHDRILGGGVNPPPRK